MIEEALKKVTEAQQRYVTEKRPALIDQVIKAEQEARMWGAADADIMRAKAKAEK